MLSDYPKVEIFDDEVEAALCKRFLRTHDEKTQALEFVAAAKKQVAEQCKRPMTPACHAPTTCPR